MLRRILPPAALACLALPFAAHAVPVSIDYTGTFTYVSDPTGNDVPPDLNIGTNFNFTLSYDTTASLFGNVAGTTGVAGIYSGTTANMQVLFGATCTPADSCEPDSVSGFSRIVVYNNFSNPAVATPSDGLQVALLDTSSGQLWRFISLSTDTSLLGNTSVPNGLPSALSSAFLQVCFVGAQTNVFGASCLENGVRVEARLTRTQVPEPASLGLMGLGLAGLGWSRRRTVRR